MGYCPCLRWRKTTSHQHTNINNNNKINITIRSDVNIKDPNDDEDDDNDEQRQYNTCPSITNSALIPPSTFYSDGSLKKEGSTLEEVSVQKDETGTKSEVQTYEYRELATATNNFRSDSFIGEGGFGPVYRGRLEKSGQVIAVKKLNQTGIQGDKEFLVEVLMLSLLRHPNLVNLIGYCAEGNQRLLVYEYLPLGSLAKHLHGASSEASPLDWNTRMKIAAGAAQGLDYLHNKAKPSVIYRDLKSGNILLDTGFNPKLSDFGLAKFGPEGDRTHVSTRVMGTQGYCAPEYAVTGKLTKMSDIFSFGVVLLELITGQAAIDPSRGHGKYLLVDWALPILKKECKNFLELADPKLNGQFPKTILRKAIELASMCVRESPHARPHINEIVLALNYLSSRRYNPNEVPYRDKGDTIRKKPHDDVKIYIAGLEDSLTKRDKEMERKLAVEDAKMWGETWREKKSNVTFTP